MVLHTQCSTYGCTVSMHSPRTCTCGNMLPRCAPAPALCLWYVYPGAPTLCSALTYQLRAIHLLWYCGTTYT